jgi:1-acyl-sn-glycerol-3-phosphate acyltransferase
MVATPLPQVTPEDGPPEPVMPRSWFWTFYYWTVCVSCLGLATLLAATVGVVAAFAGDHRRRVVHRMLAFGHRGIATLLPVRVDVTGLENLPDGPCILAPNHQSLSDVVYLYQLPTRLHFKWVVKKEFFRIPGFGISMRLARYPKIDRGNPDSALELLRRVHDELESGVSILSFPEGTRSADGRVAGFQSGTARMAVVEQVPLVPVGIAGTRNILPKGMARYPTAARVAIHVGAPIPTAGLERRHARQLTRRLREGVVAAKRVALGRVHRELAKTGVRG